MDLLIRNISVVMQQPRFSTQAKLAEATGVSQTHIGNILRNDKIPSLEVLHQLAEGMGLKSWQLLLPTEQFKKGIDANFNTLLGCYLDSSGRGRETILQVAEAQAGYQPWKDD